MTIEEQLAQQIYASRLILLLETAPQSNKYKQVQLTLEQFKKISDTLAECLKTGEVVDDLEVMELSLSEKEVVLPDEFEDFYHDMQRL